MIINNNSNNDNNSINSDDTTTTTTTTTTTIYNNNTSNDNNNNKNNNDDDKKLMDTLANCYSSQSTWQELSNKPDRVKMIFILFCYFVDGPKLTSASEGLNFIL